MCVIVIYGGKCKVTACFIFNMFYCINAEFAESDIVTSFSNPNYTLGLRASQNFMAEAHTDGSHDDNGNVEDIFGQTCVDDSGDSAISSPLTDSDLASPNTDEHHGGANGVVTRGENFFSRMQKAVNLHLRDEMEQEHIGADAVAEMNRYIICGMKYQNVIH